MNWFRQNRDLGMLLVAGGVALILSLGFLWFAKSRYDDASARFDENAMEASRLERMTPFPNETNLEKTKAQAQDYAAAAAKLQEDLKTHVLPLTPIAPNEFQTRLNQARTALTEKARANKVKLPDNFFLGFEEFGGALPDTAAAPLLGQELAQVELLLNLLIDAHVDEIISLRRVRPTAAPAATNRKPPANAKTAAPVIERNVIELAFAASPSAERRVLNQIATDDRQLYVLRTLHVLNEKDKGPARAAAGAAAKASTSAEASGANAGLHFIVGEEHLRTAAQIEMLRFTF